MMNNRSKLRLAFLWSLLTAAVLLFFCTKSSPAYPINDWCDANIYLTIGKGMKHGMVTYRDLYDHKGPLLYALHMLAALISENSFLGVYFLEVLSMAVFLFACAELWMLFGADRSVCLLIPLTGLLIYSSYSFCEGDSAEELCLPFVMLTLTETIRCIRERRLPSFRSLIWMGWLAGCVFWIKFTVMGLPAGCLLALLLWIVCAKREKPWKSGGELAAGFLLSTLPWAVYFGVHHALGDWLRAYLYDNLFLYHAPETNLIEWFKMFLTCGYGWAIQNPFYSIPVFAGLVSLAVMKRKWEAVCLWFSAAFGALVIFMGLKTYPYYGFALASLTAFAFVPVIPFLERKCLSRSGARTMGILCTAALLACTAGCALFARNMRSNEGSRFGMKREDTVQYRFASQIQNPSGTALLNYGFMDAGFYTAAGITPQFRYFDECNMPLQEMYAAQLDYITQKLPEYVVTYRTDCDLLNRGYELIDTCETPNQWYPYVYLYHRLPDEP